MNDYVQQWQLHRLEGQLNLTRIKSITSLIVKDLGFDFWRFSQLDHPQFSSPVVHAVHGNLPLHLGLWHDDKTLTSQDPLINHGTQSHHLLVLNEEALSRQASFWSQAVAYGVNYAWTQSATNVQTGYIGILSLFGTTGDLPPTDRRLKEHAMHWLTHRLHELFATALKQKFKLTEAERLVMRWTAQGKAANEVANITQLKERTVNFHISNVIGRLDVENKTAAAVKLAMNGSLF